LALLNTAYPADSAILSRRGSLTVQTLEVLVGHVVDDLSAFGKRVGF
jgi:hypothetical protein